MALQKRLLLAAIKGEVGDASAARLQPKMGKKGRGKSNLDRPPQAAGNADTDDNAAQNVPKDDAWDTKQIYSANLGGLMVTIAVIVRK
jgi:hypothetical protein